MESTTQLTAQEAKYHWVNRQAFLALTLFAWVLAYAPPSLLVLQMN